MLILQNRKNKRKIIFILILFFCVVWLLLGTAYLVQKKGTDLSVKEESSFDKFISPPPLATYLPQTNKQNINISPNVSSPIFSSCGQVLREIDEIFRKGNHCLVDSDCGFKGTGAQQSDIAVDCSGGYVPMSKYTDINTAVIKIKQYKKECGLFCVKMEPLPEMGKTLSNRCIDGKCKLE